MCVASTMYLPSDDSIFLANIVSRYHGILALEIGTSNGIILRELSKNFRVVVGTDIDFNSLKHMLMMSRNDLISSKEEGKIFTTSTASSSVRPH